MNETFQVLAFGGKVSANFLIPDLYKSEIISVTIVFDFCKGD